MLPLLLIAAAIHVLPSVSTILTSPTQIASSYDFVIVGAGTTGNVLANRLTAKPNVTVLVIEAGGSDQGILDIEVPFLGVTIPGTAIDWNYTTTPQVGADDRTLHYTRVPPADGHDTTDQVIPAVHGHGPVEVSVPGFPLPLDGLVVNASRELGGIWSYSRDLNAGITLGTGYMQSSIGGGERSDSATAYLHPVDSRTNLDILINTQVTKIIQSGTDGGKPAFRIVQMAQNAEGPLYTVTATNEVILAAGVIGTPQILQLSGIGPHALLQGLDITTIVNSPKVGKGLSDHPLVPLYYEVNSNETWDIVLRDPDVFNADLAEWMANRMGLFVDSPGNTQSFFRIPRSDPIFHVYPDPAAGPLSAHLETIWVNAFAPLGDTPPPTTGNFLTILTAVVAPTSRGYVQINSSDPFDHPLINPEILNTFFDVYAMVHAIRKAQGFLLAPAFDGYIAGPFGDLANATTDAELAAYAAENAITVNHPSGTCQMSSSNSVSDGVVNSHLLVNGASGLRIVDASIFPSVPSCHIQAIVYTVAERAATLIKAQYNL
ncbi:hypothetical protein EW026_g6469 [Hermanssonia centrifuga]|uniref:Uncharacterized protein n=1 Tax=Hermanssonia centrifuga TaxID=98765 RepID=A0A4S4KFA9_9APHY|nr:hypothetical protein EW026_g6469 [Hermanssonia centrifuga]